MKAKTNNSMGVNMRYALDFIRRCNGWHTYANDRATRNAVKRLEARGLVETNEFRMFRALP